MLALMFSSGVTHLMMILLLMEVFSWLFSMMMQVGAFKYLMVQSIFLILSLLGLMWMPDLLFMSVILKMGLAPLHNWLINLSIFMKKWTFLFMMSLHKLLPIALMGTVFSMKNGLVVFYLFAIASGVMLNTISFLQVFVLSSNIQTCWLLMAIKIDMSLFLMYWGIYFLLSCGLTLFILGSSMMAGQNQNLTVSILWLILSGLPPFVIFFMKSSLVMLMMNSTLAVFIMILSSVMSLVIYYRVFHYNLNLNSALSLLPTPLFLGVSCLGSVCTNKA